MTTLQHGASIAIDPVTRQNTQKVWFRATNSHDLSDIGSGNFAICGRCCSYASSTGLTQECIIFGAGNASAGDFFRVSINPTANSITVLWRRSGQTDVSATLARYADNENVKIGPETIWAVVREGNKLRVGVLNGRNETPTGATGDAPGMLWSADSSASLGSQQTWDDIDFASSKFSIGFRGDDESGYQAHVAAAHFGWTAFLDLSLAGSPDPDTLDWQDLLLRPHTLLDLYHPDDGTATDDAVLRAFWGRVSIAGVDQADDQQTIRKFEVKSGTTAASHQITLHDLIGDGGDMTLQQGSSGSGTTDVWVYPAYAAPTWRGPGHTMLNTLTGPIAVRVGDRIYFEESGYGLDLNGNRTQQNIARINGTTLKRDRWPVPTIGTLRYWDESATAIATRDDFQDGGITSGFDYHTHITALWRDLDSKLVCFYSTHSLFAEDKPASGDFTLAPFQVAVIDPDAPEITSPDVYDFSGIFAAPADPTPTSTDTDDDDYKENATTYLAGNMIGSTAVCAARSRDNGSGFLLCASLASDGTKKIVQITGTDGNANACKPVAVIPDGSGGFHLLFVPRSNGAGNGGLYEGLKCVYCSDATAIDTAANWYNPLTGDAYSSFPLVDNSDETVLIHTVANYQEDGFWVTAIGDGSGSVIGLIRKHTDGVTDDDWPSDAEAESQSIVVCKGWSATSKTWASRVETDISDIISARRTESAEWILAGGSYEGTDTYEPTGSLGSMWLTPEPQWADAGKTILMLSVADPDGNAFDLASTNHTTGEYPLARLWGEKINLLFCKPFAGRDLSNAANWSVHDAVYTRPTDATAIRPMRALAPDKHGTELFVEVVDTPWLAVASGTREGVTIHHIVDVSTQASQAAAALAGGGARGRSRDRRR